MTQVSLWIIVAPAGLTAQNTRRILEFRGVASTPREVVRRDSGGADNPLWGPLAPDIDAGAGPRRSEALGGAPTP
jgi:hypothetical protein